METTLKNNSKALVLPTVKLRVRFSEEYRDSALFCSIVIIPFVCRTDCNLEKRFTKLYNWIVLTTLFTDEGKFQGRFCVLPAVAQHTRGRAGLLHRHSLPAAPLSPVSWAKIVLWVEMSLESVRDVRWTPSVTTETPRVDSRVQPSTSCWWNSSNH